jgi:regulator of sigma D
LQSDNALAELLAIEDKLIDLIADAHEASETIAEVEA